MAEQNKIRTSVGHLGPRKVKHPKQRYKYKYGGEYDMYLKQDNRFLN